MRSPRLARTRARPDERAPTPIDGPGWQPVAARVLAPLAAALTLAGGATRAQAQRPDSTLLRPTDIVLTVTGDPDLAGVFKSSGTAIKCGLADYGLPGREHAFHVSFPDDPTVTPLEVSSLEFDADTLAAGTSSTSYYLNALLDTPRVGHGISLVVRAREPQYNEPGTATLSGGGGTDTLKLVGRAGRGVPVDLDLTIICRPRP
ncbi:MAG: hypothetical protein AB7R55_01595 [Gemmatimonadales bacterium]